MMVNENNVVYIIRHGETEWNAAGLYQGKLNSPLTSKGVQMAEKIGITLQGKGITYIFSSSLARAHQTATIIANIIKAEIIVTPEFEEMSFGLLEGREKKIAKEEYKEFFSKRKTDTTYKIHTPFPQGESYKDVHTRTVAKVNELIAKHKNFAIVGHSSVNRIIRSIILGTPLEVAVQLQQKNNEYFAININTKEEHTHTV